MNLWLLPLIPLVDGPGLGHVAAEPRCQCLLSSDDFSGQRGMKRPSSLCKSCKKIWGGAARFLLLWCMRPLMRFRVPWQDFQGVMPHLGTSHHASHRSGSRATRLDPSMLAHSLRILNPRNSPSSRRGCLDQIKFTNFTPGEKVGVDSAKPPGVDAIDMNGSLYRLVPQTRPCSRMNPRGPRPPSPYIFSWPLHPSWSMPFSLNCWSMPF